MKKGWKLGVGMMLASFLAISGCGNNEGSKDSASEGSDSGKTYKIGVNQIVD